MFTKTVYAVIAALALLLVGGPVVLKTNLNTPKLTKEINTQPSYRAPVDMPVSNALDSEPPKKIYTVKKIIELEAKNTVTFRGPVTSGSVSDAMQALTKLSRKLKKNDTIYLVLDTPGGSVFAGLDLIDFMKALPQRVQTVTLFAASMGFQIVQNSDYRYITTNGTLMSHRASGGLSGQFDGELESRYKMVKRAIDYMDVIASKRMNLSLKDYKAMILNEYWVHGFDAVGEKAADEQVLIRCGESMSGTEDVEVDTMFGKIKAEFSKCPLIKAPISVGYNSNNGPANLNYLKYLNTVSFENHEQFVKEFANKPKFYKTFVSK